MNAYNYLVFRLTDKCNTVCRYCFNDSRPGKTHFLSFEIIKKCFKWCMERADDKLVVQFTGGEPSLHPQFWEIFQYARGLGYRIKFTTNGLNLTTMTDQQFGWLTEKGVAVKVSLDGYDQATHEYMRGRNTFNRIMAGINRLSQFRPRFAVKSVLSPIVAKEFQRMLELSLSINAVGISYNFLRPEGRGSNLANTIDEYEFTDRVIDLFNQDRYKHLLNGTKILGIWMRQQTDWEEKRFFISHDGSVYPSQKAKPHEYLGNAGENIECMDDTKLAPQPWIIPPELYRLVKTKLQIQGVTERK